MTDIHYCIISKFTSLHRQENHVDSDDWPIQQERTHMDTAVEIHTAWKHLLKFECKFKYWNSNIGFPFTLLCTRKCPWLWSVHRGFVSVCTSSMCVCGAIRLRVSCGAVCSDAGAPGDSSSACSSSWDQRFWENLL